MPAPIVSIFPTTMPGWPRNEGIKIAINTDAHSTSELDVMIAGVNQARRGCGSHTEYEQTRLHGDCVRRQAPNFQ